NSNTSLIKTADNVMISLRYAPFHHHIVIFPTLFYFRFLGVTSLTNEHILHKNIKKTAKYY
ncbi:hypothetical protein, partial [Eubacterium coprostanoligenes]|uniref:hypothetical protein n=1 Tax=Eubacterium coprostanoligenes TaxID=290054 RepID=UPI002357111B